MAGGFVGVDPAQAPGGAAGRIVEYRWPGRFITRCVSDSALWWVSGVEGPAGDLQLWAVGDRGRIVWMRGGRCESLTAGVQFAEGEPTYWGVLARAPNDVWIVGGSSRPDGPRGVLLHGDGTFWRQERIPDDAAQENLYKIAADGETLYVVGSGGLVLRRTPRGGTWQRVDVGLRATNDRVFTASCAGGTCFGVGVGASGFVLTGDGAGWRVLRASSDASLDDLPGLNGVWARGPRDVLLVGVDGVTLHFDGTNIHSSGRPPPTSATLHAVGGFDEVVLAAGGELSTATPAQRGVILIQGDGAPVFTLDGRVYASGGLQRSSGGAGQ